MRYFLSRAVPPLTRVLLVESGSRGILDRVIPVLRRFHSGEMEIDLVTCYAGAPEGFAGRIYHVSDYAGPEGHQRLYQELAQRQYALTGIICSGEPIMTKWKWALSAKVPSKLMIVNENADFFWVDRSQWRTIIKLALYRLGMTGSSAVPAVARLLFFPVTLTYLLLFAGAVHIRRKIRIS